MLNPPLDAEIMTEEIFGPLLPIITVRKQSITLLVLLQIKLSETIVDLCLIPLFEQLNHIQESIEFINSRPKPLTIYAFTKDETFMRQIVSETSSGSVVFNDTIVQVFITSLFRYNFIFYASNTTFW